MRKVLVLLTAVAVVALSACGAGTGSQPPPPASSRPPDLGELRALLEPHAGLAFDAEAVGRGCPGDQALGAYLAMLVKNGGEGDAPGDTHRLTGGCGAFPAEPIPIDPPASPAHWYCKVDAYTSDPAGESPWHYELRLRVRRADRSVDPTTLACPGAP